MHAHFYSLFAGKCILSDCLINFHPLIIPQWNLWR